MRITWKGILRRLWGPKKKKKKALPRPELVMGPLQGRVSACWPALTGWVGGAEGERLAKLDSWFHSHYIAAPHIIVSALAPHTDLSTCAVLDVGCGDGIMALGVHRAGAGKVVGVDLTRAFDSLLPRASAVIGLPAVPEQVSFRQGRPGQPMPADDGEFDVVYSWSVFEHVDGVPALLSDTARVLRSGGFFYLQISPLYYSPFGSHLMRLIEEPWAHLLHAPKDYEAMAAAAGDHTRAEEKDLLYLQNEFEQVKRYLIGEYHSLNRIRTVELVDAVRAAGFEILSCELGQVRHLTPPPALTAQHDLHDLLTSEIRLLMRKPGPPHAVATKPI